MKTNQDRNIAPVEDDFWTVHVPFFTANFPTYYTKSQKVWGRFHISQESYFSTASKIIPIKQKKGTRTYIMMQPYVLEPQLTLTVGLYRKPKRYADQEAAIGETIGESKQNGFRQTKAVTLLFLWCRIKYRIEACCLRQSRY